MLGGFGTDGDYCPRP